MDIDRRQFLKTSALGAGGLLIKPLITNGKDTKIAWFKTAKFGMFIHWGLYSQLAGEWKGGVMSEVTNAHNAEQIDLKMKIPNAEYEKTAKHQDGFAMFKSKYSDYNIVDATPFDRDPVKELLEECRKASIKFGIYYSDARDFHEAGANWNKHGNTWDFPPQTQEDFEDYFYGKVFFQVEELLTNYSEISLMWFDVPYKITEKMSKDLRNLVLSLQPDCIINSRIGNNMGDYVSIPDRKEMIKSVNSAWETCATINDTWGYSKYDHDWKSDRELIISLVDIVSKGGNYLLNVGPTGNGIIPEPSVQILKGIGRWIDVNAEAIYAKNIKDYSQGDSIRFTMSRNEKNLYAITFQWPGNFLTLENVNVGKTFKVYLLGYNKPLEWENTGSRSIIIQIPEELQKKERRPCDYAWTFKIVL